MQISFTPQAYAYEIGKTVDEGEEDRIRHWLGDRGLPVGVDTFGTIRRTDGRVYIRTVQGMQEAVAGSWLVLHIGLLHMMPTKQLNIMKDGVAH